MNGSTQADSVLATELKEANVAMHDVATAGKFFYDMAKLHMPVTERGAHAILRLEDIISEVLQAMREESVSKLTQIKRAMGRG